MKKIGLALQIISVPVLISSFFVKDNESAVKRRWIAVGLFGAGWSVEFLDKAVNKAVLKK